MHKPPIQTWISPKVEIRHSSVQGKGIFAMEDIPIGEEIVVWGGIYTNKAGADDAIKDGKLVMQWDEDLFSVEDRGKDDGYYVNHSCEPNLWITDVHTLSTNKEIKRGEELTADYAMWEAKPGYSAGWECHCGSSLCRRQILGTDWELPELQERYRDHFTPLINKRILS